MLKLPCCFIFLLTNFTTIDCFLIGSTLPQCHIDAECEHHHCSRHETHHCSNGQCTCQAPAIDGGWSTWSSTSCSTTCGDGVRVKTRTCTQPAPMHGGRDCSGESTHRIACTNRPCPGTLSQCHIDADCRHHHCARHETHHCSNGQCTCQAPAIDGGWSTWSSTSCSTTCGDGVRVKTRTCTQPAPMHGGRDCSGESTHRIACTIRPCPSTLSQCHIDADCEHHHCSRHETHHCSNGRCTCQATGPHSGCHIDADCQHHACNPLETHHCSNGQCACQAPAIDGGWSAWSRASCSTTCGHGIRVETRTCTHPAPSHGGRECSGERTRHIGCTEQPCPINGEWSSWSAWSSCSRSCGSGTKMRTRDCNNPAPVHGGKYCLGESTENNRCADISCPVGPDCPTCDANLTCQWNSVCAVTEVCMIREYRNTPFTVHCTQKEDCEFMKDELTSGEIFCCNDRSCLTNILGLA